MCLENCYKSKVEDLKYDPLDSSCFGFELSDSCDYIDTVDTQSLEVEPTDLTVLHLNIRGLLGKQKELSKFLFELMGKNKIDMIILCETWLTKESEKRVNMLGYTYHGHYRKHKRGGGVGFLISDEINYSARPEFDCMDSHVEASFIELLFKGKNLLIGSLYHPPNTNPKDFLDTYKKLTEQIQQKD